MRRSKNKQQKIIYVEGYDHYDKHRTIPIQFFVNEAEKAFLDDLFAVLHVQNKSEFIRNQVFHAYQNLTNEQKEQMIEGAKWRHENDNNNQNKNENENECD